MTESRPSGVVAEYTAEYTVSRPVSRTPVCKSATWAQSCLLKIVLFGLDSTGVS